MAHLSTTKQMFFPATPPCTLPAHYLPQSFNPLFTVIQYVTLSTMTSYDNYSAYTPVEVSTPPRSRQATPVSTPSRAALLKQTFTPRGSPIKFSLDKLEKTALRDIE